MAKNRSIIKVKGTLGELTFYESGGENIVKTRTSLNGNKIKTDPAFKRTRENNQEFGGAAKIGKSFRMGFASLNQQMGDRYLSSRVTALMRKVISRGIGLRGQREFQVDNSVDILTGFEFNATQIFDSAMFAPSNITLDANRSVITWDIPAFSIDDYIRPPVGATHFRLVVAAAVLSNFQFSVTENNYIPVNPDQNETNSLTHGNFQELSGLTADENIVVDLGLTGALPATASVNVATGISFYQEINGDMYELSGGHAMKLALIALA